MPAVFVVIVIVYWKFAIDILYCNFSLTEDNFKNIWACINFINKNKYSFNFEILIYK